jgi:hypothetical protein
VSGFTGGGGGADEATAGNGTAAGNCGGAEGTAGTERNEAADAAGTPTREGWIVDVTGALELCCNWAADDARTLVLGFCAAGATDDTTSSSESLELSDDDDESLLYSSSSAAAAVARRSLRPKSPSIEDWTTMLIHLLRVVSSLHSFRMKLICCLCRELSGTSSPSR